MNDLRELKDLINKRFDLINERMNERFDNVNKRITELRINQEKVKTRLDDWKPSIDKTADLSEKIGDLKNWRQITLVLITGIITSLFWIFKDRI
jgi:hypothetical protein